MRFKEIKEGMEIYCENPTEKLTLLRELENQGYLWKRINMKPTSIANNCGNVICIEEDKKITHNTGELKANVKFSDLIMPELTGEEVLQIAKEICDANSCGDLCPLCDEKCIFRETNFNADKILEVCTKWKEEHKEPELEWVYICRIIEVKDNGYKSCVHEVELKDSMDFENELETILKDYIATNKGKYFACREYICRVKESED